MGKYKTRRNNRINETYYTKTNPKSSEQALKFLNYLKKTYPDKKVIDISDRAISKNYKFFIKIGIKKKIIMIIEKNNRTQIIFDRLSELVGDLILTYGDNCIMCESLFFEGAKKAIDRLILGDYNDNECKICYDNDKTVRSSCCMTCGQACCQKCLSKLDLNTNGDHFTIKCPFCQETDKGFTFSAVDTDTVKSLYKRNNTLDVVYEEIKRYIVDKHKKECLDITDTLTVQNYLDFNKKAIESDIVLIAQKTAYNLQIFETFINAMNTSHDGKYFMQYKDNMGITNKLAKRTIDSIFGEINDDKCDMCDKTVGPNKIVCECSYYYCHDCLKKMDNENKFNCIKCDKQLLERIKRGEGHRYTETHNLLI
jgi:hypothetical protein